MILKYSAKAHGYWLDGRRCKSPSAVAKVPDDSSSLDKWRRRQTARGIALRPDLTTRIATATNDRDLDDICEEAMNAAGASISRDRGTAIHRITEIIDEGSNLLETPEVKEIRRTWQQLLTDNQLTIVTAEGVIAHPDLLIAGRFDRIVEHTPTRRRFILDIKTGTSAAKYLHAHAIQLWLYASAPHIATGPGGDTDYQINNSDWQPLTGIDQNVGLIAHLPADAPPAVIPVDIAAGRDCFHKVIQPTWAWRARTDLQTELPTAPPGTDGWLRTAQKAATATRNRNRTPATIEGATVHLDDAYTALRAEYATLTEPARLWIGALVNQSMTAGVSFRSKDGEASQRRLDITRALVTLAAHGEHNDDILRALLSPIIGDTAHTLPTAGHATGTCNATQAAELAAAARQQVSTTTPVVA